MLSYCMIILSAILFGGLWGYIQGMIMIQPDDPMSFLRHTDRYNYGVRNHRWFSAYHRVCIYCMAAFAGLVSLWWESFPSTLSGIMWYLIYSLGCGLITWAASETMYSKARYDVFIGAGRSEHVNIADLISIRLSAAWSKALSWGRYIGGLLLVVVAVVRKKKSPR